MCGSTMVGPLLRWPPWCNLFLMFNRTSSGGEFEFIRCLYMTQGTKSVDLPYKNVGVSAWNAEVCSIQQENLRSSIHPSTHPPGSRCLLCVDEMPSALLNMEMVWSHLSLNLCTDVPVSSFRAPLPPQSAAEQLLPLWLS